MARYNGESTALSGSSTGTPASNSIFAIFTTSSSIVRYSRKNMQKIFPRVVVKIYVKAMLDKQRQHSLAVTKAWPHRVYDKFSVFSRLALFFSKNSAYPKFPFSTATWIGVLHLRSQRASDPSFCYFYLTFPNTWRGQPMKKNSSSKTLHSLTSSIKYWQFLHFRLT